MDEGQKKRISEGRKHSTVRFKFTCQICQLSCESKSNKAKRCPDCSLLSTTTTQNYINQSGKENPCIGKITVTCSQCNQGFETVRADAKFCSKACFGKANRKPLPPIEVVKGLYWDEKLSANEIGRRFGLSGQTIRNYMRSNDVDRREERHQS